MHLYYPSFEVLLFNEISVQGQNSYLYLYLKHSCSTKTLFKAKTVTCIEVMSTFLNCPTMFNPTPSKPIISLLVSLWSPFLACSLCHPANQHDCHSLFHPHPLPSSVAAYNDHPSIQNLLVKVIKSRE